MPILNVSVSQVGQVGISPSIIYILTDDTLAEVTTAGYLNGVVKQNIPLSDSDIALVTTKTSPNAAITNVGWLAVQKVGTNWSLVATTGEGNVVLPTITNHLATYTNTTGQLSEDAAIAINGGSIQAGLSGTVGSLISFPATAASGSLNISAANSAGNTVTTITNASQAAARVYTIPDGGANSNFLLTNSSGTQTISTGSLTLTAGNFTTTAGTITAGTSLSAGTTVTAGTGIIATAGNISAASGIVTGVTGVTAGASGSAASVVSFPATAANGFLALAAVNAGGAFNTTISNGTMGQSTVYTMGDIGATTGGIVVATSAIRMKSVAGAAVAGGAAANTIMDAFCTTGSNVVGNFNTQATPTGVLKITPGNGSFVVTSTLDPGASTFNYIITK